MYQKNLIIKKTLSIMDIFKTPLMNNAPFTIAILFCSSIYVPKTFIIRKALFIMAIIRILLGIIINYTSDKSTINTAIIKPHN